MSLTTFREKILDRATLLKVCEALRSKGQALVHCHGCFDIVHPGHIRHLRQARSMGDRLLVSVTGDAAIQKGTGRPLIPEELRAEGLASLDCVDFVYIEPAATATELLKAVKPDVYVKGREYELNTDPRFLDERSAVEAAGGRVVFSSGDIVFSSTALIAGLEQTTDPFQRRLAQLAERPELSSQSLYSLMARFRGKRIVIVGETILDTYILCDQPRIASESPVLTLRPLEARHYDGGAAIIARHLAALGARPTLVTPLPNSADANQFRERMRSEGIEVRAVAVRSPLPEKQRFLVGSQKVMKLDLIEPMLLDLATQDRLVEIATVVAAEHGADGGAIIADFGLGFFSPTTMVRLCDSLRPLCKVLAGDVSGPRSNLLSMRRMDLLTPSETELRDSLRLHSEGLPLAVWRLLEATNSKAAAITMGPEGVIGFSRLPDSEEGGEWKQRVSGEHVPALCGTPFDPLGCGDAFLASATLALLADASLLTASFVGAAAAAVEVQRLGNLPIAANELRQTIARIQGARLTYTGPDRATSTRPALAI